MPSVLQGTDDFSRWLFLLPCETLLLIAHFQMSLWADGLVGRVEVEQLSHVVNIVDFWVHALIAEHATV